MKSFDAPTKEPGLGESLLPQGEREDRSKDQEQEPIESFEGAAVNLGAGNLMDSKTSHLDDQLGHRLEGAFSLESTSAQLHEMAKIALEFSPIDLAHVAHRLPSTVRYVVYENLPDWEAKIAFFINSNRETRSIIYRHLTDQEVAELIERMPADEAVYVLENFPERRWLRIVDRLGEQGVRIHELQQYEPRSAGRLMTGDFFAFHREITIGEAATVIRERPEVDFTRRIFVVSKTGELEGYVPARNLIVNPHETPLRQVMRPIHHIVHPETSRDEVVDLVERYTISGLPVVDHKGVLIGVVNYEDVVEAIEDIADDTIAQMAGTSENISELDPMVKRFFARAPWLLVTLLGGLVNATSIAYFEGMISPWLTFAIFFVPLITGMSGNVGVQCSTVLVRSMAIGVLSSGKRGEAIAREISIGLLTGLVFGVLCGVTVYLLNIFGFQHMGSHPLAIGVIVSLGLLGACLTATFLGVFSPLFFAAVDIDPAVASGPIVTAMNDVLSMVMYFLIAQGVSALFFPFA